MRVDSSLDAVRYAARAVGAIAVQPYEGFERALERVAENAEAWRSSWRYVATSEPERRLHELLDVAWPCDSPPEFDELWRSLIARLRQQVRDVGRGAFGGWDDADCGLARITFCLTRHLRPDVVVETGVARGLTSSLMLEALERNGRGRLWSIDLPPLIDTELGEQTACAVQDAQRRRWTLLKGSSRRLLPGLVGGLRGVDLFVHDSMHTTRNVRFELEVVWPALAAGGVAVVDDVEKNRGLGAFVRAHPDARAVVFPADDRKTLFGCLIKPRVAGDGQ
jgi:predicted O-methyltransferase YrrM